MDSRGQDNTDIRDIQGSQGIRAGQKMTSFRRPTRRAVHRISNGLPLRSSTAEDGQHVSRKRYVAS